MKYDHDHPPEWAWYYEKYWRPFKLWCRWVWLDAQWLWLDIRRWWRKG